MQKLLCLVTLGLQLASELGASGDGNRESRIQSAGVNSQQGEASPQVLSIREGNNATMNCSYRTGITNLQWYRQDSGKGPALVILIRSNEREKRNGRLTVTLDTSTQRSILSITASLAADAATYFCATEAQ
ncbi:T-cell receptor alpha chain V region CTL-L17 [Sciurus carolinensis]|nr:T-cell receptor alpha chain V region CTL-L17 [Sciurus carolinensis]